MTTFRIRAMHALKSHILDETIFRIVPDPDYTSKRILIFS